MMRDLLLVLGILAACGRLAPDCMGQTFSPTATTMTARRFAHTATLLPGGRVLVAGGSVGSSSWGSAECFDPVTTTWTAVGSLTGARARHAAAPIPGGRVLVCGGDLGSGALGSAEARLSKSGVDLVSITQNFSTADAMGRLTLNMLMSFAEFEREMIAERTRDKMTAARRRGKWTGGQVPLGYNVVEKKLVVNELEAVPVREIFTSYIESRSALAVKSLGGQCWWEKKLAPRDDRCTYSFLRNSQERQLARAIGSCAPPLS